MRTLLPVLVALMAPTAADAAPQVIAEERMPFTADSHAGTIAWSSWDETASAYRLRLWRDGRVTTPPIATRGWPFDVDLGTDRVGRVVAVYSRCAQQGHPALDPSSAAVDQSGCDLYVLDVATGRERALDHASSTRHDEHRPSVHAGRLAFVRTLPRPQPALPRDAVRTVAMRGGRPRRVPVPAARRVATVESLELGRLGLVYVYGDERFGWGRQRLFRVRGQRLELLYRTASGGANESDILTPSLAGSRVYFAERNRGSGTGNRLYRLSLATGRLEEALGSARYESVSWLAGRFAVATGFEDCSRACRLQLTESVSWRRP